MNNKEKYVGKVVNIFPPKGGRKLDTLVVSDVLKNIYIYGKSEISGIETSYDLSDGIRVEVINYV